MKSLKIIGAIALVLLMLLTVAGCGNGGSSFNNNGGSHFTNSNANGGSNTNAASNSNSDNAGDYDTGISLSEDLMDFTIQIDGAVYRLPMDIAAFKKNGWSFPDYFDGSKLLNSDSYESTKLEKNGEKIDVQLLNKTGDVQKAGDCPVGRITYDFSGSLNFYLAGNFNLNTATLDSIIAKYGEPSSNETYGEYTEIMYEKEGSSSIYERYTFKFNATSGAVEELNVVNFIATKTSLDSADASADNSAGHTAPTSFGSDPATFNVSVLGELYTMPAPF